MAWRAVVLQQINHGISTGALFLIVGVLYERRHTRMISEFGRPGDAHAEFRRDLFDRKPQLIGNAAAERVHRRVHDFAGGFQVSKAWPPGARWALCWARRTCCGCTSG